MRWFRSNLCQSDEGERWDLGRDITPPWLDSGTAVFSHELWHARTSSSMSSSWALFSCGGMLLVATNESSPQGSIGVALVVLDRTIPSATTVPPLAANFSTCRRRQYILIPAAIYIVNTKTMIVQAGPYKTTTCRYLHWLLTQHHNWFPVNYLYKA